MNAVIEQQRIERRRQRDRQGQREHRRTRRAADRMIWDGGEAMLAIQERRAGGAVAQERRAHSLERSGLLARASAFVEARSNPRTGARIAARTRLRNLPSIPAHLLSLLASIPIALMAIAAIMTAAVPVDRLFVETLEPTLPALLPVDALHTAQPSNETGEPLSIDPTPFESIRLTEHIVQPGETISGIAAEYGLHPGTILKLHPVDVRRLLPGTVLTIPNRDGLFVSVEPNDSLSAIAKRYGSTVQEILDANDLSTTVLHVGESLFVPGARMSEDAYLLAIGELLDWPLTSYRFTDGYGMRTHPISGAWQMHTGIDLANVIGTPVLAAADGRVVHVESQLGNYGRFVLIDHGNGYTTLYGHLDSYSVQRGEWVRRGQQIGELGNTGRSTGPHLHFEVRHNGVHEDPIGQLR